MQISTFRAPSVPQRAYGSPRFGAVGAAEEKRLFNMLPPEAQVLLLVNQCEELDHIPEGFEPPKYRAIRLAAQKKAETELLAAVKSPNYGAVHAVALLTELYMKREELSHVMPEAILEELHRKISELAKAAPEPVADTVDIPPGLRKRMQKSQFLPVTTQWAPGGEKGMGSG